jgi:hypothetical protein
MRRVIPAVVLVALTAYRDDQSMDRTARSSDRGSTAQGTAPS